MTTGNPADVDRIELAKDYFTRVDSGDGRLLAMFTDDAQIYYPTSGIAHGTDDILRFVLALNVAVSQFHHDQDRMVFTLSGDRLAVEGVETGELADGRDFPGNGRSGGLFCNVFEFRENLISRLHIYADPDYTGKHTDLFAWE
jgi:hypothetical protein